MAPPPRPDFTKVTVEESFRTWRTTGHDRTVLVVVRTATTVAHLRDVLAVFDDDRRIQVVFTHDPGRSAVFAAGLAGAIENLEAPVIPWELACSREFDLALAASENDDLHRLNAPVVLLPHGLGYQKYYPGTSTIAGMNPERLVRGERVIPSAIVLSHSQQRDLLARACPPAAGRGVVAGDVTLDRLLANRHRAGHYRRAFGTGNRTLVLLASTWGPRSLFGTDPALPERLLACLPADEYQVALSLHAGVWAHGPWQVRSWLSRAREHGLCLLPEGAGWHAALLAADLVVSDRGSLSVYAAATGTPLLLAGGGEDTTVAGSAMAALAGVAPALDSRRDLASQLDAAVHGYTPTGFAPVVKQAVDNPGGASVVLRRVLYELLRLPEPQAPARTSPIPAVTPETTPVTAYLVAGTPGGHGVALRRFPAGPADETLDYQHRTAHIETARLSEVEAADVLYLREDDFPRAAAEALRRWPHARIVAAVSGPDRCVLMTRDTPATEYTVHAAPGTTRTDPLLVASLAYVRLSQGGRLPRDDRFRLGDRCFTVTATAPASPDTGSSSGD
ncbi:hypothetical protein ABZ639_03960 [Saccharomonospora sp. NPDC006951]